MWEAAFGAAKRVPTPSRWGENFDIADEMVPDSVEKRTLGTQEMNEEASIAKQAPIAHPISIEFFSKKSNKTTQLVNSDDSFTIEGAHRWYEYEFLEPVYLTDLKITSSGYDSWNNFEVEIFHTDQTTFSDSISVTENIVSHKVGKLALGFRFRPATKWVLKTAILKVVASGYSLKEFHEFEWFINNIVDREAKLTAKESKVSELDERIKEKTDKVQKLTSEIGKMTGQQAQLDEQVAQLSKQRIDSEASQKDLQKEIEQRQEVRRELRAQIADDKIELNNLTTKLRLFPSEISGFVEEGSRNIRNYLLLSSPFVAMLGIVLFSLFSNSIDLTQLWKLDSNVNVWTIFLTRLPFVLVAVALVETCGYIVGRLIFEIVRINRQRLEFSKLSIVAKDVVTAVASNTEMNAEDRFAQETKLKMALLQEHMKSQSEVEFRYAGSPITSAVVGVANRLMGGKSG